MKKVSLIMPIYNAERFLRNTLDDVLAQSYSNIELIAVNDCSTDSSFEILTEYENAFLKKGYTYVVIVHEVNKGLCAAINSGLQKATGELLCFPDADDEILPDYVSSMAEVLEQDSMKKWVRCDYTIVLEEENRSYDVCLPRQSIYKNDFYDFISKFVPHNAWNMMVQRDYFEECIGKQIMDTRLTQEWSLLLPLSFYSDYVRTCKISYRYHIRKNAMSSWQKKDIDSVVKHFNDLNDLNISILRWMKIPEQNLRLCKEVLDIYYTFAKYKAYRSRDCITEMEAEYTNLQEHIKDMILLTDDPEFAVRMTMDKLLNMTLKEPCELFNKYKKLFADGYEIYIDNQGGKRLLQTTCKAFGIPSSTIQIKNINDNSYTSLPKACLIENSGIYEEIVKNAGEIRELFCDYRELRDALRGWAYFERGRE